MSNAQTNARVGGSALFNLIRRLHFYIGLFVAPFIFVAALTGTLYVLTPQLENYVYNDALTVIPAGEAKPLSAQVAAARHYAGEALNVYAVRPSPQSTETTRVQFVSGSLGPSESRSVFVDPYSLAIKGDMTVYGTSGVLPLRLWLDQLHRGLLLGDLGRNYSELAASWLWVAALGGVVLWRGTRPRRAAKKIRGRFAVSRHWHITLGLMLVIGLLFFSVTGLTWSQWAGDNIDKMRSSLNWLTPQVRTDINAESPVGVADPHAEHSAGIAMPMPGMDMAGMSHPATVNRPDGDWDKVLDAARAAGISAQKVELRQPKAMGKAWTVTEVDRRWPTQVDAVSVNPKNFAIVDHVWFEQFPLAAKLTRWGVDAHMGILFGVPNQLILVFFGLGLCSMIVLGYRMWWLRRPAVARMNPLDTLCGAWLSLTVLQKSLVWVMAALLGYALPVMGISVLLFMSVDIWRWWRMKSRFADHHAYPNSSTQCDG
ncbi:PepSY-associated TM helix domain-containing protein [Musicola paradisiaca]|uniref:PepSY-associated TM helix domain protein n=1 Tax=Musicola paradisiaca (strain Ech703) TaxID=579405 RepID=C6C527_MUSP7|nr:PepSY-associated TM helix domain-containing protein [Musicola paradisiaca]ACS85637.1 PepSY-associated TM helix domain protein [Musicola paradisiaca Ech703]